MLTESSFFVTYSFAISSLVLFKSMSKDYFTYLDYDSTTPVDPRVLDEMLPYVKENYANPNSSHSFGQIINSTIFKSRIIHEE